MATYLLNLVQQVQTTDASADLPLLTLKEAGKVDFLLMLAISFSYPRSYSVYKAVELCAFELYDDIDYDSWFQSQLVRELQIQDPRFVLQCHITLVSALHTHFRYKIIRHRVTWILGTWVTVKMSPQLRPSLYSVLVPLLARNEDLAVSFHSHSVACCVHIILL